MKHANSLPIGAKADTRLNRRQTLLGPAAWAMGNMLTPNHASAQSPPEGEVRTIAKEATIYGFPLVDSYRIQYSYSRHRCPSPGCRHKRN
jgi:hypothetical protein